MWKGVALRDQHTYIQFIASALELLASYRSLLCSTVGMDLSSTKWKIRDEVVNIIDYLEAKQPDISFGNRRQNNQRLKGSEYWASIHQVDRHVTQVLDYDITCSSLI